MFSRPKGTRAKVFHILGISSRGEHRPVAPRIVGTDEIMQAYQTVKLAMRRGPAAASDLCTQAAARVAGAAGLEDLTSLQVRIDVFDSVAYWQGRRRPQSSRVVAECPIRRNEAGA